MHGLLPHEEWERLMFDNQADVVAANEWGRRSRGTNIREARAALEERKAAEARFYARLNECLAASALSPSDPSQPLPSSLERPSSSIVSLQKRRARPD
ncbi:hypothetical protein JCM10450v2_007295 [Rhodotorula kratochvilovae]